MSTAHHVQVTIIPKHLVLSSHVTVHISNIYHLAHLSSVLYLLLLPLYHFSYPSPSSSASTDTRLVQRPLAHIRCRLVLQPNQSANVVKHVNQDFGFPQLKLPQTQPA